MTTAAEPKKVARVRKLFCRREADIEGKTVRFEMRADGIHVRRKHSRKVRVLSWRDACCAVNGQGLLGI